MVLEGWERRKYLSSNTRRFCSSEWLQEEAPYQSSPKADPSDGPLTRGQVPPPVPLRLNPFTCLRWRVVSHHWGLPVAGLPRGVAQEAQQLLQGAGAAAPHGGVLLAGPAAPRVLAGNCARGWLHATGGNDPFESTLQHF